MFSLIFFWNIDSSAIAAVINIPHSFGQIFVWADCRIRQGTNRNHYGRCRFNDCRRAKRYDILWQKRIKYAK